MRAIQQNEWGGPEALRHVEIDPPVPDFTEVQVRVAAAGVNPVDYYTGVGQAYNRMLDLPFVPGWDVAGVVERVGYGVTRFAPGDRVYGMPWFPRAAGAYAEYVTAPSRHFAPMPEGLSFAEAAALPLAGLTALQMLVDTAHLTPGQRVLIGSAAGGVGHLGVQIAKSLGAYVIATASAGKHEFLRSIGADDVLDYTAVDIPATVRDIDVAIQMFGGDPALRILETLRPGGIMVNAQAAWTPGMSERAAELGVRASSFLVEPDPIGLAALSDLVATDRLKVHIDTVFPLEKATEAQRRTVAGRTTGKIVLSIDESEAPLTSRSALTRSPVSDAP